MNKFKIMTSKMVAIIFLHALVLFFSCSSDENISATAKTSSDCNSIITEWRGHLYKCNFSEISRVFIDSLCRDFDGISSLNLVKDGVLLSSYNFNDLILKKLYSISERAVVYRCVFLDDSTKVEFSNSESGVICTIDVQTRKMIADNKQCYVDFIKPNREYDIIINKDYQTQTFNIIDPNTKQKHSIELSNDGPGGAGKGIINPNYTEIKMPHGYYKIHLVTGGVICKKMEVKTPLDCYYMLIYGDSVSEPEAYYPSSLFPYSWTQLISNRVERTITSGCCGISIDYLLQLMKAELPCLKVDYVMITIGTNGGNTSEILSAMIDFLLDNNIQPILNHIPCNQDNTQVNANLLIDKIRDKYNIYGVDFDKCTSINGDGKDIDKTKMFWENYVPWNNNYKQDYWHHPNKEGSEAMYNQFLQDVYYLL